MLTELTIENFAIIEQLHVRFDAGFTVLTGETGAGKSIIIDALQGALGARVPSDAVRAGARTAVLEAVFDLAGSVHEAEIVRLLTDYGVEEDDVLILRREVNASGRGIGRINGRAVPLAALLAVGSVLVDIHGQSDHLAVLRGDRQLEALDRYGNLMTLRAEVGEVLRLYSRLRTALDHLVAGQRDAEQRLDLLQFQVGEIEDAALAVGEEEALHAERQRLANAERLSLLAEGVHQQLVGETASVVEQLRNVSAAAQELAAIDVEWQPLAERIDATRLELEDAGVEARGYRDAVEIDPQRLDAIEERLHLLTRLRRKYGATVEEILEFGAEARRSLDEVEHRDDRREALAREVENARLAAADLAAELSEARAVVAGDLSASMGGALQGLGLKATAFQVQLMRVESADGLELPGSVMRFAFNDTGIDRATFLVSFNPGEPLRPLDKVASGGETSRFLLALKSVLALADQTPTLVFDEVDVGVGARSGMVVAERLRDLARSHQVLSITHLPQIAAAADHHLTVSKAVREGSTGVAVQALEREDRVREIAEMLSGSGSEMSRRTAAELLESVRREG